ncbi:RmlC-like cupin domain-containing protein [Syncephalis pseudoplumigaleata]|uniref:RmlC-like cupin domain-containing protein n=1 Tax=Syncephalis pseudoplumigaleata TaxID=1712513 RepID=A0A4P9YYI9_9FUNG|nr:RmlC-like cupin domain-containing protein [Syncephalis pseudoplumigaleata]|eukprot:RKP25223.1 RmlC-like cupin domain-containing protein [Syncephalis pseudoplumigaleata]
MSAATAFRSIAKVVANREMSEGMGARVRRSIGTAEVRRLDPFLLLDHFTIRPPAGFPDHPHRGFETVTYVLKGAVEHEDFAGHRGRIGPGDLQWMTAGRGIVHAEMPAVQEESVGLQLWINLPADQKMCEPAYQEMLDAEVPRASPFGEDGGAEVKVIAGEQFGVHSRVRTRTPILYVDVKLDAGKELVHTIPESYNGLVYVLDGKGEFGSKGTQSTRYHTLLLSHDGGRMQVKAADDTPLHYLLIAGEPLNEPVAQYGPFVMSDEEGIATTMLDYQTNSNGFERARKWRSGIADRH